MLIVHIVAARMHFVSDNNENKFQVGVNFLKLVSLAGHAAKVIQEVNNELKDLANRKGKGLQSKIPVICQKIQAIGNPITKVSSSVMSESQTLAPKGSNVNMHYQGCRKKEGAELVSAKSHVER